ncbi:hypothetical protein KIKIMORA_00700 [Brevundimonas phage vB_BpoS-Kikimora]|uniref:HD domain-containing protein n=1 Tax=Brevundimonas phage vB_BpoS-Kikimora TaxID=2948601 RepID=A0A9E7MT63_9CAUD|nr:hypothetical protein KIKIMORA_00700 [Brevundimonas phage vB_BpoS-Kikimora]
MIYVQDLQILRLYDEPHRRYHSVFHVLEMLELHASGRTRGIVIPDYRNPIDSDQLEDDFVSAVMAHDCVYQIGREKGWNERESLRAWQKITGRHETLRSGAVQPLILATINHDPDLVPGGYPVAWRPIIEHMIDLDLAGLGAEPAEYDRNSANIKAEYLAGGADPALYDEGRRRFLAHMLTQPTIFHTAQFKKALEARARANIQRALAPGYGEE